MTEVADSVGLRRDTETDLASIEAVHSAVESLTEEELLRLERYAHFRIRSLGGRTLGRDAGDLVREALAATLGGDRRWNLRNVDFFTHLVGVMRSLAGHWNERERAVPILREADRATDGPGFLSQQRSPAPGPDRIVEARETLERIEKWFEHDPHVKVVLEGLRDGLTGVETQAARAMSRQDYESALKRMRRGVDRLAERGEV